MPPKPTTPTTLTTLTTLLLTLTPPNQTNPAQPTNQTNQTNQNPTPARIIIITHPNATQTYTPHPPTIQKMLEHGLRQLWQTNNLTHAWRARIQPTDTIGIRVHTTIGTTAGTRPAVAAALIKTLLKAGHPPQQIILWDKQHQTLKTPPWQQLTQTLHIQTRGAQDTGYDPNTYYQTPHIGTPTYGDLHFGTTHNQPHNHKKSHLTLLLTQHITKIINLTPLLNHNHTGANGNLHGLALAAVDNTHRFQNNPQQLALAIPQINAHPQIKNKLILNITDALLAQYQGQNQPRLQDTATLNQLHFSTDPLALDTHNLTQLQKLRTQHNIPPNKPNQKLYQNAHQLNLGTNNPNHITIQKHQTQP